MADNPWAAQLTSMAAYERIDPKAVELLSKVTLDPEESAISSLKVPHGAKMPGHLIITNKRLRWVGILWATNKHDEWPLLTEMQFHRTAGVSTILQLSDGSQFQTGVLGKAAQELAAFHQMMVQAARWDDENLAPAPVEVTVVGGGADDIAGQIGRLEELREKGTISDDQFEAGKNKVLGLS